MLIPTVASQANMFYVKHTLKLLVFNTLLCNTIFFRIVFSFFLLVYCVCLFFVVFTRTTEGNNGNTMFLTQLLFL